MTHILVSLFASAGMRSLQQLELDDIVITDTLLLPLATHQQLQKLVFNIENWGVLCEVTERGATAVAHASHIEINERKGIECRKMKSLLQLPSFKRWYFQYANLTLYDWSPQTCICCEKSCLGRHWPLNGE